MAVKQLNFDCQRLSLADNAEDLSHAEATYCMRQQVFHNVSSQQGQFMYSKHWQHDTFANMILLQCPDSERDNNSSTKHRSCDVSRFLSFLSYLLLLLDTNLTVHPFCV